MTALTTEDNSNDFGIEDKLLSITDLAEHLGISKRTIYNWRAMTPAKGPVAFELSGGAIRFFASDVARWIKAEYDATKTVTDVR